MCGIKRYTVGILFLMTFARCSFSSSQDELWLLRQLQNNEIGAGSKFPYGHPKPYSETDVVALNGDIYGCSTYLNESRRLIILLYWYYPSDAESAVLHSAQIASTSFKDGEEKWLFFDEAKLLKFISLSSKKGKEPDNLKGIELKKTTEPSP